jgi:hypothetical protein
LREVMEKAATLEAKLERAKDGMQKRSKD